MSSEYVQVDVHLRSGVIQTTATLIMGEKSSISIVILGETFVGEGAELFSALVDIRRKLDSRRILLLCAGARLDVYPSRMSRQARYGRNAYALTLGQPATRENMTDIFASALVAQIATPEAQLGFYESWLVSLS